MKHKILRLPDVKALTGLSRSLIYDQISKGNFPSPVPLGARAVGWVSEEVLDWIQKRIEMRLENKKEV